MRPTRGSIPFSRAVHGVDRVTSRPATAVLVGVLILGFAVALGAIVAIRPAAAAAETKPRCIARAESHHATLCVTRIDASRATFRLAGFRPGSRWNATTATGATHGSIASDGTSAVRGTHGRDSSFTDDLIPLGFTVSGTAKSGAHVKLDARPES